MNLKEIKNLYATAKIIGDESINILGIKMDSRKVVPGDLFICVSAIPGFLEDRHKYAGDAVKLGAVALMVERELDLLVPQIVVKDARYAMAILSAYYYGYPSNNMQIIGVTGTNGKTTTSAMIQKLLSDFNINTGLMGNFGTKIEGEIFPSETNTQESIILQQNLAKMRSLSISHCVMEVTSQGIDMKRTLGCDFKIAVFSNLTQDHLDYHLTMENYKLTKGLLFARLQNGLALSKSTKYAVLNADDPASNFYSKITEAEVVTYGIENKADVMARNIVIESKFTEFDCVTWLGTHKIRLNVVGRFNVYNSLAAICTALIEGVSFESIEQSMLTIPNVPGRMEALEAGQGFTVIVDYAHTPDGLYNALTTIGEFAKNNVITVFGCGGNRDKKKRPVMGEIAAKLSNNVIVTSDNPRTEDPLAILEDIEKGIKEAQLVNYELIVDRKEAIQKAIRMASPGDVILIAGKGDENYQIINHEKLHFDDREVTREILNQAE